jgi:hypothetical protein
MTLYGSTPPGQQQPQQQQYAPPPAVRFEAISEAWRLVTRNMGTWVVATLVYLVTTFAFLIVLSLVLSAAGLAPPFGSRGGGGQRPEYLVGQLVQNVVSLFLTAFFTAGLWRMALKDIRGQTTGLSATVGDLFSGGDVLGKMTLALFLSQLAAGGAAIPGVVLIVLGTTGTLGLTALIPGILLAVVAASYVFLRLYLASGLVADRGLGGMDALRAAWAGMKGHVLSLFAFGTVLGVLIVVGTLLTCGLGSLVLVPLSMMAYGIVYSDLFGGAAGGPTDGVTLDMPLPPPSAYGPGPFPPPPAQ